VSSGREALAEHCAEARRTGMSPSRSIAGVTFVLLAGAQALGCDGTPGPTLPSVSLVEVSPASATVTALGATSQFTAVAKDANGNTMTGQVFSWSSSNTDVASVDAAGLARAEGSGAANITATTAGVSGSATLTVSQQAVTVDVTPAADTLWELGATSQFTASATDENGHDIPAESLLWSSSDPAVATVDASGLATAEGPGKTTITATANAVSDDAVLTVFPPVEGPQPSSSIAAFYYSWYGNPEFDGQWIHWTQNSHSPPDDIASDYYPVLGAYSSTDRLTVARHMAWVRQAGIGVIITTWWGQSSLEDDIVPLLLDVAAQYGIGVAFHVEPYHGRSADRLVQDIQYLYEHYGSHPAFFRTTASTRWNPDDRPKGLFYLFAPAVSDFSCPGGCRVEYSYWRDAMDAIHGLAEATVVIGQAQQGYLAEDAHFDGIYEYITIRQGEELDFSWAESLPARTLYVPGVAPGNSARRIDYPEETYLPRLAGETYREQWNAALAVGIQPFMVAVTSFNEWHEGSQIEPALENVNDGQGYDYASYQPLPPDGYLTLTSQLAGQFLSIDWPESPTLRVRMTTTSDWTTLRLLSGERWGRPDVVSVSAAARLFRFGDERITLIQSLDDANTGQQVEGVMDMLLLDSCTAEPVVFEIDRGHIGWTRVGVSRLGGESEVLVGEHEWSGIGPPAYTFEIACPELTM
jgi:hypothetical protein